MADVGRPAMFDKAEDLILAVENYFTYVKGEVNPDWDKKNLLDKWLREPEPVTITGLALFLGFESRQSIYDYAEKGEFSYIIKNARLRVENTYEQNLHANTPTGSIFALKNMGWKDKTETEHSGEMKVSAPPVININVVKPTNGSEEEVERKL